MLDEAIEIIQTLNYKVNSGVCPASSGWYSTCGEIISTCDREPEECWMKMLQKQIREKEEV